MFDQDFDNKILSCLAKVGEFNQAVASHIKPEYFEGAMNNNLAKMFIDFFIKYQAPISNEGFSDGLSMLLKKNIISNSETAPYIQAYSALKKQDVSDFRFILEKTVNYIKSKELRKIISETVESDLKNENFDKIEQNLRKYLTISSEGQAQPYNYKDNIEQRFNMREENKANVITGVPTGIRALDEAMNGRGWYPSELYLILGSAKAGKTMSLIWFANSAAKLGYKVVYFSCETSKEVLSDRMDAMNTETETNLLLAENQKVYEKMKECKMQGDITFFDYPAKTLTAHEIERQIKKLEVSDTARTQLIIVDYVDIMKPTAKYNDKWQEQTSMCEDLRKIAKQLNIAVLSASQVNRSGSGKAYITGSDIAGSWDKIATADGIITLGGTPETLAKGELIVRMSEFRNAPSYAFRIKTDYGMGKFYSEFVDDVFE